MHRFLLIAGALVFTLRPACGDQWVQAQNPQPPAAQPPAPGADPAMDQLGTDLRKFHPKNQEDIPKIIARIDQFLAEHKDHSSVPNLIALKFQLLKNAETPETEKILDSMAADPDPKIAEAAKQILEARKQMADLKSKPLDLKFKTSTGEDFDIANWRGKVVLIDFWASWCGPCIQEMPNVVEYYKKMHDKGVEVVGISLDQDKSKMEAAIKQFSMPWPQYFDGEGWKNKISTQYGIDSIPRVWVVDKEGKLRTTTSRLGSVEKQIDEMLKEG